MGTGTEAETVTETRRESGGGGKRARESATYGCKQSKTMAIVIPHPASYL